MKNIKPYTSRYITLIFNALVSAAIISAILYFVDFDEFVQTTSKLNPLIIIAALIINITGSVVLNAIQIRHSLHEETNHKIPFFNILSIDFIVRFYSLFIPVGATAIIRAQRMMRLGVNILSSSSSVVLNKAQQISMASVSCFFALLLSSNLTAPLPMIHTLLIASLFISIVFCAVIYFILNGRFNYVAKKAALFFLGFGFFKKYSGFKSKVIKKLDEAPTSNKLSKKGLMLFIFWSSASFLTVTASHYIVINSIGVDLSFIDALFLRGVTLVAMMIPFSIAGIGFREVATVGVLSLYGLPVETGLAVGIILFGFQLVISIIGAIFEIKYRVDNLRKPFNA